MCALSWLIYRISGVHPLSVYHIPGWKDHWRCGKGYQGRRAAVLGLPAWLCSTLGSCHPRDEATKLSHLDAWPPSYWCLHCLTWLHWWRPEDGVKRWGEPWGLEYKFVGCSDELKIDGKIKTGWDREKVFGNCNHNVRRWRQINTCILYTPYCTFSTLGLHNCYQ